MKKKLALSLVLLLLTSACALQNAPQKKPEQNPAPPVQASNDNSQLINRIKRDTESFDGEAGVYAKNLKDGKTIAVNENHVFPTASTHKLIVALATYKYLYPESTPDKKKQYDIYIKNMMQVSDNPSFYRMVRELDSRKPTALTQVLNDLQLKSTWIYSDEAFRKYGYHSVTTPFEMAEVFEAIYREQYLGREMSTILKEELVKTIFQDEIPRFMQRNKVMHKVGSLPGMLCDVGIIDDGRDQILISIYTTSIQSENAASLYIADTSAKLYNALRSTQ